MYPILKNLRHLEGRFCLRRNICFDSSNRADVLIKSVFLGLLRRWCRRNTNCEINIVCVFLNFIPHWKQKDLVGSEVEIMRNLLRLLIFLEESVMLLVFLFWCMTVSWFLEKCRNWVVSLRSMEGFAILIFGSNPKADEYTYEKNFKI